MAHTRAGRPVWLAGDTVRIIDPHTEADPVALLVSYLVAFGNVIGRRPHCKAEADYHALNEYAVLVGMTSKGRKGTSWGHVKGLFSRTDSTWASERIQSGLSSGEGLIWAVRDPITKREPVREKRRPTGEYEEIVVDPGIDDKRLLVLEPEFASTLRVLGREGSTLSPTIREAWDTGDLRTLTKNSPAKATGAHISIIGHITKPELLRYLDTTEAGNGFGNRFLWMCVRRSKVLPESGRIQDVNLAPLLIRQHQALEFARATDEITRDGEARAIWWERYPGLSEGKPGLLGAMTSRAEAHVMRLSCVYALLDCSRVVRPEHLEAALALWEYAEASARFVFGASLGDPLADELLKLLQNARDGLTRTDISNLFGRHKRVEHLTQALSTLLEHGLVRWEQRETGGRTAEVWFAVASAVHAN